MKYNLCSSCVNFQPMIVTPTMRVPRSCKCPKLKHVFGTDVGFMTGIDIIHCDFFQQHSIFFSDVMLTVDGVHGVGYVRTADRKKLGLNYLYDNSKNVKICFIEDERKRKITEFDF